MKWKKIGNVFSVDGVDIDWMKTHASVPFADYIYDDLFKIYFSTRDSQNRSNTGYICIDIKSFM